MNEPAPLPPSPRALRSAPSPAAHERRFAEWELELHGHRVIYRTAGQRPAGRAHPRDAQLLAPLGARRAAAWPSTHTVIAPDLIGHGDSATPRGDYSLGAHATSIRDLLSVLGVQRATIVGHSLGGGVAMQFINQFPQRTERLVLISSGGLGREVSPLLRTAALPGVSALLSAAAHPWALSGAVDASPTRLSRRGSGNGDAVQAIVRALRPLQDPGAREAFLTRCAR